jgi:LysM repeat protein/peptidoglycan hydrolase-like protein with peptidoglycan-binding domain
MGTGNLIIQVRNAEDAVPLSGVRVRIMDNEGRVLYVLTTDESGDTGKISLETVDRSLSLDPNYRGTPYTSYDLEVEAKGFNNLHIIGVQIFDGENAIQPVSLIPMQELQRTVNTYEIVIGKHAVEMTEPRNQTGPLMESRILRQVIIPNPITVHLGRPTSSASNVQVSFPDYVKNVASSEIYPTWPQAALEANIYAIITFALNRVFTEWYRSRGYNFDITNSTAYDQYFVYGRTIYESISKIVDEIFNQYVRREEHIAPFFTSFCNGTTATCPGLSQWGTVNLANQGLSPLQILRYYYPDDIEIVETNIITDIIVSYPGTALRTGSTGLDVQTIQTYLNRIRRNYPAIPLITDETGVFGSSTQAAVKKFQSIFNLSSDGIVGKATWNKISSIYVAITKLADLNSEGTALGIGTVPPSTILRWGSSGIDVITLQYILSFISEYYPTIPDLIQNGRFDGETYQAVLAFQQMMGISADGIVGPATWNALYDIYWGIIENTPGTGPEPEAFEYIVQSGDSLWLLAKRFHTTIDAIKALNNLTSDVIDIGQVLKIPSTATSFTYTVRAGDTLWLLSQRFHTTVDAIKALNNLTNDVLDIGQILQIPQ